MAIGTGLAILGAGVLGAGASIWGSNRASNAQQQAAQNAGVTQQRGQDMALAAQREGLDFARATQREAFDIQRDVLGNQRKNFADAQSNFGVARRDALDMANRNFGETRENLFPWINSGHGANNLLSSFYGLGADPALGQNALARFAQSPDYQFALQGGVGALDNSASAKGSMLSGNQLRAVTEYGQGLATQNLGNYLQRLTGMSTQGMNAANSLGQFGAQRSGVEMQLAQMGNQLGQIGTNLGTGVSSVIGSTASNAASGAITGGNAMANTSLSGSNNMANTQMAGGTAEAAGILGGVRGFNSGLNALSLYNQMGQSSYAPTNLLASYNGNQIGQLY